MSPCAANPRTSEHWAFLERLAALDTPIHKGAEWLAKDGKWVGPLGRSTHLHRVNVESEADHLRRLANELAKLKNDPPAIIQAKLAGKVAAIDVDDTAKLEKTRAELDRRGIEVVAETASPREGNAGRHLYVARSASLKHTEGRGEWAGVEIKSNASITTPGSVRPKPSHEGRPYVLVFDNLDKLLTEGPDPAGLAALDQLRLDMLGKNGTGVGRMRAAAPAHVRIDECPEVEWDMDRVHAAGGTQAQTRVVTEWLEDNWRALVATVPGTGYNTALNEFTFDTCKWVEVGLADWWPEEAAEAACREVFGGPDAADSATIASAVRGQEEKGDIRDWSEVRAPVVDPATGEVNPPPGPEPAPMPTSDASPVGGPPEDVTPEPVGDAAVPTSVGGTTEPGQDTAPAPATTSSDAVTGRVMATSLVEAIATGRPYHTDPVELVGDGKVFVKHDPANPDQHGTWVSKRVQNESGEWTWTAQRIASYYMWQCAERVLPGSDLEGHDVRVRCEVVTPKGTFRTHWMGAEYATSPNRVLTAARARVSLSGRGPAADIMRSALVTTAHEERTVVRPLTRLGWHDVDGRAVWAGNIGSVDGSGALADLVAEALQGKGGPITRPAVARIGYDRTRDEVGPMVSAWRTVGEDWVTLTLLGMNIAALCRLSRRGSVLVLGETDAGKTLLVKLARAWTADVPTGVKSTVHDLTADSVAGGRAFMAYASDQMQTADDLRQAGESNHHQGEGLAEVLSQVALGGDAAARGTETGGVRADDSTNLASLMSGEKPPERGAGITNRILILRLVWREDEWDQCTLALEPDGALDDYKDVWADSGEARAAMGRVIQWIAARADALGSLAVLSREMDTIYGDEYKRLVKVMPKGPTRPVELAAVVSTGLIVLRRVLADLGQSEHAPSQEDVDAALATVVAASRALAKEDSPYRLLVEHVATRLASGRAVLTNAAGGPVGYETGLAAACGWPIGAHHLSGRPILGRLSVDGVHAVLTNAALEDGRTHCDRLRVLSLKQLQQLCKENTEERKGDYTDPSHGVGRVRGYVVLLEDLGVEKMTPPTAVKDAHALEEAARRAKQDEEAERRLRAVS